MSIASAISALQSASLDIAEAIAAKGVTVPVGSGFGDYAALIEQISGGTSPVFVDYIETDGTAYINTGIKGDVPFSSELIFSPVTPTASSGYAFICGSRKDATANSRFMPVIVQNNNKLTFCYGASFMNATLDVSASINNRTFVTTRTAFMAGNQILYKKQASESSYETLSNTNESSIITNTNIYLFCYNNQGSPSTVQAGNRVKSFKIYNDYSFSNLVFDGVACVYNGEYGLWDNVSNTFFGNAANSGAFTGPSI